MNLRAFAKILLISVLAVAFTTTPLYAKPKEDKGNSNPPGKPENTQPKAKKSSPVKKANPSSFAKAKSPLPHLQHKAIESRKQTIRRDKEASQAKAFRPEVQRRIERRDQKAHQKQQKLMMLFKH